MKQTLKNNIPKEIQEVAQTLINSNFECYIVGGCVRDLILNKKPTDWDLTTNAKPEQIISLFTETFYENDFGTVGVVLENVSDETLKVVEITPYRLEGTYSNARHPDAVTFSDKLEDDLQRRDFTMNAIALNPVTGDIVDPYQGQQDIKDKVIKTVGEPNDRFTEDALRIMRAVRFKAQLGFNVSQETFEALKANVSKLENVSRERIRDEFSKLIASPNPMWGLKVSQETGILKYIAKEFADGVGCEQKGEHIYDVFDHLLHAVQHAADKGFAFHVRLAALFHDIGKPKTRRPHPIKDKFTFYGHEVVGARITKKILEDLRFPKKTVDIVTTLVRHHMFFSDTEKITLSAVRRIIAGVGKEYIWDLMQVRECDRVGMKKKETPYRLRKYHSMIEEALRDPISVSQLAIDGNYLINEMKFPAGPRMGWMLHALLEEVLENPKLNTVEQLHERVLDLNELPDTSLRALGERGKERKEREDEEVVQSLRKKHGVK